MVRRMVARVDFVNNGIKVLRTKLRRKAGLRQFRAQAARSTAPEKNFGWQPFPQTLIMFGIPAITRGYPSEKSRIFAVFPEFGIFGRREFKTVFGKKSFLAIRAGAAVDMGQKMKMGREDRRGR